MQHSEKYNICLWDAEQQKCEVTLKGNTQIKYKYLKTALLYLSKCT